MATTYIYEATVQIGVWAMKAGSWQRVSTLQAGIYAAETVSGERTYGWAIDETVQMGQGVQRIGLSLDSTTGQSAAITAFTNAMWQAQGVGGSVRSATPAGQKAIVTVRP